MNEPKLELNRICKSFDETEGDSAIVFTYGLTFNKVDDGGNKLEGAKFTLEKKLADGRKEIEKYLIEIEKAIEAIEQGIRDGKTEFEDAKSLLKDAKKLPKG